MSTTHTLSISTTLVTKQLVVKPLYMALKSAVSAPWSIVQLCPSSQQILATPLARIKSHSGQFVCSHKPIRCTALAAHPYCISYRVVWICKQWNLQVYTGYTGYTGKYILVDKWEAGPFNRMYAVAPSSECLGGESPPNRMLATPWRRLFLAAFGLNLVVAVLRDSRVIGCCPAWQIVEVERSVLTAINEDVMLRYGIWL